MALIATCSALGQTYTISTFAGGGLPVSIPGTSASLYAPPCVAVDKTGNIFFVDQNAVLRLDATTGLLSAAAGTGTYGFSGDNGPATSAQLASPSGIAVDSAGSLFIADTQNNRIRKVSNGTITTVAGNVTPGLGGDNGPATSAFLDNPMGVAIDSAGNIYIADSQYGFIRKVSNGVITTVAGNGTQGFGGDNGPATSAQLGYPTGVAVDVAGNIFIADSFNKRIRKVSNGVITTVAGGGTQFGDNGPATSAQLAYPWAVAVDSSGNLYIADINSTRIREVSNGVITTVAGNGSSGGANNGDNGPATSASLANPAGVAVSSAGNLYIADTSDNRIRKVSGGVITTVAGNGTEGFSGDNGAASSAQFALPWGIALDSAGNLYIADRGDSHIREVSKGVITTVAGGGSSLDDNSPATSVSLLNPYGVALDSAGNLYIADGYSRIRKVSNGVITTVAGNGTQGFSGDNGPAISAELYSPTGVTVDADGNLYIADTLNNCIRKVSNGVITTVAGNGTARGGLSGDNGPATSAQLNYPTSVALDFAGNLYIADTQNNRIRKVTNGVITTVAGSGPCMSAFCGLSGDNGPATSAQLSDPLGIALDSAGSLYIADSGNNRIRRVSNGVITTVAGGGTSFNDDGPATSAQLAGPVGVTIDSAGKVYIADSGNNRIRLLTPSASSCTYSVTPTPLQAPAAGGKLTLTIQTTASCSWTISNLPAWITVSGASSGTGPATVTLVAAPNAGATLSATISIAGVSVAVTQSGASACTYSITPGGQAFAAAGGSGSINITAGAACPWTAVSTATWVTFTGVAAGSGNGTVTYQAATNTGTPRSGVITIAGLSFTAEEGSASVAGFTNAGSMAQLASAGYWTTTITLVNTGSTTGLARLNFFDNNGNPLMLPLSFPQSAPAVGPLLAATLDRTLNPGAELVILTTGPTMQTTQQGWAQLFTNGTIGGFAVFSQAIGSSDQEAVVPLETRNASTYVLSFDNTNGADTGIALANLSAQTLNTAITISDDSGALILSDTVTLPAMGHTSIDMATRYGSSTTGRRGTLQFTTPSPGQISVLGLRFTPTGAFTTIPPLAK